MCTLCSHWCIAVCVFQHARSHSLCSFVQMGVPELETNCQQHCGACSGRACSEWNGESVACTPAWKNSETYITFSTQDGQAIGLCGEFTDWVAGIIYLWESQLVSCDSIKCIAISLWLCFLGDCRSYYLHSESHKLLSRVLDRSLSKPASIWNKLGTNAVLQQHGKSRIQPDKAM